MAPSAAEGPLPEAVEAEVARLVNELRTNPNGALWRPGPLPSCVQEPVYEISVDPGTGTVTPAPALAVDHEVSMALSRSWSVAMNAEQTLAHRDSDEAAVIYSAVDRDVAIRGENVSRLGGYEPAVVAWNHFANLRDSPTGHFCNLVSPAFTHIGIGAHHDGRNDWLTQNVFRLR